MSSRARTIGLVLLTVGVALLVCDLLGYTAFGRYANRPPRGWERFDPDLAAATPGVDALYAAAGGDAIRALPAEERLTAIFDVVTERFTHGGGARHTLFRNWVAWSAGLAYPPAGHIREPEALLRYGHSAWCSEQSAVFAALATRAGVPARLVWLDGHVVAEAEYMGGWHAWDPDLEVVPRGPDGRGLPVRALADDAAHVEANYGHRGAAKVAQLTAIYGNSDRHRYEARPAAARSRRFERATAWLKWLLPLVMVGLGVFLLRTATPHRVSDRAVAPDGRLSGA